MQIAPIILKDTKHLDKEFTRNRPEIIVYDDTFFPAIAISEKLNIPRVAVYHSGLPLFEYPIPPIGTCLKYGAYDKNIFQKYLGYEKAIIVGSSEGVVIAMFLAADLPEKVSFLILDSFSVNFTNEMLENNVINERIAPHDAQTVLVLLSRK